VVGLLAGGVVRGVCAGVGGWVLLVFFCFFRGGFGFWVVFVCLGCLCGGVLVVFLGCLCVAEFGLWDCWGFVVVAGGRVGVCVLGVLVFHNGVALLSKKPSAIGLHAAAGAKRMEEDNPGGWGALRDCAKRRRKARERWELLRNKTPPLVGQERGRGGTRDRP